MELQTSASYRQVAQNDSGSISLSEIISALSFATDLTEGAVRGHALRSCLLGMRIADEAGVGGEQKNSLYYALLLKDIGNQEMIGLRCDRGASIVSKLGMGEMAADAVRSIEEHWDGTGFPKRQRGQRIPLLARVCAVAQHLDVFSVGRNTDVAIETLEQWSGTWFDPHLVRAALALNLRGELWSCCRSDDSHELTRAAVLELDPQQRKRLDERQIDLICEAFADIVDSKSHFTYRHSIGVAEVAHGMAQKLGLPPERVKLVRRAALLHDIGKLSVANSILDKRTPLSKEEWKIVERHPGLSRQILEMIEPFREMAIIAGEHHEKLDGTGYPNRLMAADLSLESRIVAVADVYSALSEDRPYRPGMDNRQILPIMRSLTPDKLDVDCVDALAALMGNSATLLFEPVNTHAGSVTQVA
ncbi:MAG: HD domain-containing protein [Edaphobacter sp.]|uniref:HD-GYP domain-containing protein n=1 Tax=Edaphobacter sp. TaxID=1934404 RepID=UPI0023836748|nr:HD-GYP domain-containing protein [Edaphobacter sp.]MDE1177668.1 HD domain-containing protein [Edaphobacter sp.]